MGTERPGRNGPWRRARRAATEHAAMRDYSFTDFTSSLIHHEGNFLGPFAYFNKLKRSARDRAHKEVSHAIPEYRIRYRASSSTGNPASGQTTQLSNTPV